MARKYEWVDCEDCGGKGRCACCKGKGKVRRPAEKKKSEEDLKKDKEHAKPMEALNDLDLDSLDDVSDDNQLVNPDADPLDSCSDDCLEMHDKASEVEEGESKPNPVTPHELEEEEEKKKAKKKKAPKRRRKKND